MRKLLLLALMGLALSKAYFGSLVPPELRINAPGFDIVKDRAKAPKPGWFTRPAHLDPEWMHPRPQAIGTPLRRRGIVVPF